MMELDEDSRELLLHDKIQDIAVEGTRLAKRIAGRLNVEHLLELTVPIAKIILRFFYEIETIDFHVICDLEMPEIQEYKNWITIHSAAASLLITMKNFNEVSIEKFIKEAQKCGIIIDQKEIMEILNDGSVKEYSKRVLDSHFHISRARYPRAVILKLCSNKRRNSDPNS